MEQTLRNNEAEYCNFLLIIQIVEILNQSSQPWRTQAKETKKKSTHLEFNVGLWVNKSYYYLKKTRSMLIF